MKKLLLATALLGSWVVATPQDGIKVALRMNAQLLNNGAEIAKLKEGDSILVLPETKDNYLLCRHGSDNGYIGYVTVDPTRELIAFHNWPENIGSYFEMIVKDKEWKAAFRKDLDESIERQNDSRFVEMVKKYGQKNGMRVTNGEIWVGMSSKMLEDSRGRPDEINRTVTRNTTHEQWVYGRNYIYVDNGIVSAWQD